MPALALTTVSLGPGVPAALEAVPPRAGVGQILGPDGRRLLAGRAANLRRWAASRLGAGRPVGRGRRPPTDLRPVATAIAYLTTTSAFHQRLAFERLVGDLPPEKRRDLKPPVYLHLDSAERFPRVTIRLAGPGSERGLYGPFLGRAPAGEAVKGLHKLFPLRPCDYVFEPSSELPLGLGCVYAQVRSCSAPCLVRISEAAYRGLAAEASAFLARPSVRPPAVAEWLPPWVAPVEGLTALVAERGAGGIELYPVAGGAVLEERAVTTDPARLDAAVADLSWAAPEQPRDDRPWLAAWIHERRRTGTYVVGGGDADAPSLAQRVRAALNLEGEGGGAERDRDVIP